MGRLLAALLFLLVAGCSGEPDRGDLTGTLDRMSRAGYDWSSVAHWQSESGVDRVRVELRTASEPAEQAAKRAAQLVWTTHEGPLDIVTVEVNDKDVLSLARPQLKDQFGPRDERLDPVQVDWTLVWSVVLAAVAVAAVVLIVVKLRRRARQS